MAEADRGWQPKGDDFRAARERIKPFVHITPLLRAEALDRPGRRVFLKTENLQRTGSFKVRGAFNAVGQLDPDARARGPITYSSGNHAQALALAARELGLTDRGTPYPCTVFMPEQASPLKVGRTKALGAEVLFAGASTEDRRIQAQALADSTGRPLIPAYDDPRIVAGQGTLGLEIMDQWMGFPARTRRLGLVAAPVGGGGLMSGVAAALRVRGFAGRLVGVEPSAADDTRRSLVSGRRETIPLPQTICDGLMSITPGELTFPILKASAVEIAVAEEEEIKAAAAWLLDTFKLLVEPSGAVCVAAWSSGAIAYPSEPGTHDELADVVLILSGGNVEPSKVAGWCPST